MDVQEERVKNGCALAWRALLCSTLFALTHLPAAAQGKAAADGWEVVFEQADVRVHRRYPPGSDLVETYTTAEMRAAPKQVLSAITDYANYPQFMPHIVACRVLSERGDVQLIFQRLRILQFLFDDRFHVVRNRVLALADGSYRVEWTLDTAAMQALNVKDAVPTQVNSGYWELEPIQAGSATRIRYYLQADPGGSIPRSFANMGTVRSIPEVIEAVRRRALSSPQK